MRYGGASEFGRVRLTLDEWIGDQAGVQLLAVSPGGMLSSASLDLAGLCLSYVSIVAA